MMDWLLNALLFFPLRPLDATPADLGLPYEEIEIRTEDAQRLHGWWVPARGRPSAGHVLLFNGNAGNISHRLLHARLLSAAGLDLLLFDYRGYGRSTGRPDEAGTYRDGRAALQALRARAGIDPRRIFYVGESLGGGVALELALRYPPRGLVLQSTFTSVRDMARLHYPLIPRALVPDAYPNLDRIRRLAAPLLIVHGDRDDIVPLSHGEALYRAAPEPKRLEVARGAGHNDLIDLAGGSWGTGIAAWAAGLPADQPVPSR